MKKIKIGTRGSLLALAQANIVKYKILEHNNIYQEDDIEIKVITTSGDRIQDRNLAEIGGKGLFTKEIEEALLNSEIDLAVHSMKDMPALITDNLSIDCLIEREDPRDAFISINEKSIYDLKENAVIGTSSARRRAQILNLRPDIKIIAFRGNVTTRIEKLATRQVDATLLAMAGLKRLNIDSHLYNALDVEVILPAVAQGAIGIQTKKDDEFIKNLIIPLNCIKTNICISAERAYLIALGASCATSIAALATLNNNELTLKAEILKPDGSEIHKIQLVGKKKDATKIGEKAALELTRKIDKNFWES